MEGSEGSTDGRPPEAVSDETEVCQTALYPRVQDECWAAVAQRGAVLSHQVCKLLADLPGGKNSPRLKNKVPNPAEGLLVDPF